MAKGKENMCPLKVKGPAPAMLLVLEYSCSTVGADVPCLDIVPRSYVHVDALPQPVRNVVRDWIRSQSPYEHGDPYMNTSVDLNENGREFIFGRES